MSEANAAPTSIGTGACTIKLKLNDDEEMEITAAVSEQFETFRDAAGVLRDDIVLSGISARNLKLVVDFCEGHLACPGRESRAALSSRERHLSEYDVEYCKRLTSPENGQTLLFEVTLLAEYLGYTYMVEILTEYIASMIRGKTNDGTFLWHASHT